MPFGNPEREKSFRCRFTHFFRESKHLQLLRLQVKETCKHEYARKRSSKSFCYLRRTPVQLIFQQKRFYFPRLPRVMAYGERCIGSKMSFSSVCYVARQSQGGSGGNGRAPFLATSWGAPRSGIKKDGTDQRAPQVRSMIVRRNGRLKFSPNAPNFSRCLR